MASIGVRGFNPHQPEIANDIRHGIDRHAMASTHQQPWPQSIINSHAIYSFRRARATEVFVASTFSHHLFDEQVMNLSPFFPLPLSPFLCTLFIKVPHIVVVVSAEHMYTNSYLSHKDPRGASTSHLFRKGLSTKQMACQDM